ncbi:7 transmembrane receptor [Cooperia oncophora]
MTDAPSHRQLAIVPGYQHQGEFYIVTAGYISILLIGLVGNILVISVLRKHPLMKTHSSIYIMNLAMADLITLSVGLPFEVIMNWSQYPWPFPDVFCHLKALIAETTKYVHKVLCAAWILSVISASPFGFYHRADYILKDWPGTENHVPVLSSKMCMVAVLFDRGSKPMYKFIFHLSALLFFVIPLSIIFVLHIFIAIHVRSSRKDINRADADRGGDDLNSRLTFILGRLLFYSNLLAHKRRHFVLLVSIIAHCSSAHLAFSNTSLSFFYFGQRTIVYQQPTSTSFLYQVCCFTSYPSYLAE